jgi:hypothetical protein
MSGDLTPDERRVRALTHAALELELAARAALIERNRAVVELLADGGSTPTPLARAMKLDPSRVRQIRNQWPETLRKWADDRPKIEAEIKALDE